MRVVDKTHDPARELPRIDVLALGSGGFLAANCHMMMHVVGRSFAKRYHVTLANLQRYLPLSNDPGCSAGFGMGMVMALGAQITQEGPKGADAMCGSAPTRFRQYTCFHSLGHAYMRYYDGYISYGLKACRALADRLRIPVIIHLAETQDEVRTAREKYASTPTAFLESLGSGK